MAPAFLLVGSNDLSYDLGIPGQFTSRILIDGFQRVVEACRQHGKWPGIGGVYRTEEMRAYLDLGARFVLAGSDVSFMTEAASNRAQFVLGAGKSDAGVRHSY